MIRKRTLLTPHCVGCAFRTTTDGETATCDYIFKTGHRRPCPPGDGCTERLSRREWLKKKKEMLQK